MIFLKYVHSNNRNKNEEVLILFNITRAARNTPTPLPPFLKQAFSRDRMTHLGLVKITSNNGNPELKA